MPVSSLMCSFRTPPSLPASSEYSSALARQVAVWVSRFSSSTDVYSTGVCPRIKIGIVMPPLRSSSASSRQLTAR